ncbi:MAG: DUF2085 domain-containing protein [Anaerolineae bacterium]|nr:DUF2085 domain-containing protein [Anaerolineae bacterium]MDW8099438.1 DUF2085 domain-containing protein [Anaerolineae bacterium]
MSTPWAASPSRWVAYINRLVYRIARHWLALCNGIVALFLALPIAAPLLLAAGATTPAQLIYLVYLPVCHQLPERSYFLLGEKPVYTPEELEARGMPAGLSPFQRRGFRGNEVTGYKVAFCERDVAIYGSILLAGLAYGALRRRGRPRGLPLKIYVLFLVPLGLDGLTQLVGLRESNWWLRTITGALFGGASVWLAYPLIDEAMEDTARQVEARINPGQLDKTQDPRYYNEHCT